jgi:site-specific recombinase XerD
LGEASRGTLAGSVRTGVTLSEAAAEWLRYCEHERAIKASTLTEYRHTVDRIVRSLGDPAIEDVTPEMLERWKSSLTCSNRTGSRHPSPRARNRSSTHGRGDQRFGFRARPAADP